MKRSTWLLLLSVALFLTVSAVSVGQESRGHSHVSYIIVFKSGVEPGAAASEMARAYGVTSSHLYQYALRGMAGAVPVQRLDALRNDPRVAYIEPNQQVFLFQQDIPTGIDRMDAEPSAVRKPQFNASAPVDVDIAIIDTGIDIDHPDLNVVGGRRFYTQVICILGICLPVGSYQDDLYDDDNGHGTHVGGTAAAKDDGSGVIGVAPGARLWAVKVIASNGSGYMSDIIGGIDWVTARASTIEVANMSFGCECASAALNTSISNSVAAGVVYAAAAGNSNKDTSTFSPGNHPNVITVSAFADFDGQPGGLGSATCRADEDDTRANFSNYGSLVEITAPGVCILSTYLGGGYLTISGTSMATPHVTGAAALYRAANPGSTPLQVRNALIAAGDPAPCATPTGICADDPDGIQEPLLDVGEGVSGPPNNPPVANAGGSYSGTEDAAVSLDGSGSSDPDGDSLSYSWDFGDGSSGSGVNAGHAYAWGGSFTATLTVDDGRGGVASASTSVAVAEVNDAPVSNPGGSYSGVAGTAIVFDGSASTDYDNLDGTPANDQPLTFTWDFGDGNSASGVNVSHTYSAGGAYTVTLTVSDGLASNSASTSAAVSASPNNPPTANAGGPYSGTEDAPVNFDASASSDPDGDPLTYTWDFGDGSSGTGVSASHVYLWGGSFTATVTVDDGRGGIASASASVVVAEVNDAPSANPGGPYSGVAGTAITFNGSASSDYDNLDGAATNDQPLTYTWDFGDGSSASGVNVSHTYSAGGTYTVTLTVSDGLASHSASTSAAVSAPPVSQLTVTYVYPNPLWTSVNPAGTFVYGTGFMPGAVVTLENGEGPAPVVLDAGVVSSTSIALLLSLKDAGPRVQTWDVRVTNPNGSTAVLVDGLTIERK